MFQNRCDNANAGSTVAFDPDSKLVTASRNSPNHNERQAGIDILLLHYTGMTATAAAVERLCDPAAQVSSHYVVAENGDILQLVPEGRRAWHAGASWWQGATDINSHSIGIEIGNPGHNLGYPDFPEAQIEAVIALCRDILVRHRIPADRVLAHSDVAPVRKSDPGEKFPWRRLYRAGIGAWVEAAPPADTDAFAPGAAGVEVAALQEALGRYGYGIDPTGTYDGHTAQVVAAFQRHFRPARVDGRADRSTRDTLNALLRDRDTSSAVGGPDAGQGGAR